MLAAEAAVKEGGRAVPTSIYGCTLLLALLPCASGHSTYAKLIPNGENVRDARGRVWRGVGHTAATPDDVRNFAQDGYARNRFGLHFAAERFAWTEALCKMDSDGDGLTNGEELGDPHCLWRPGLLPSRVTNITHPGMSPSQLARAEALAALAHANRTLIPKEKAPEAWASGLQLHWTKGVVTGRPFLGNAPIWLPYVALPAFVVLALGLWRSPSLGLPHIRWLLVICLGQAVGLGVSIGYHRYFSHKSYSAGFWGKSLVGVLGSASLQGDLYEWAYMHRIHHRMCDQELDFHSPLASSRGFWFAHATWYVTPKPHIARSLEQYETVIPDIVHDPDLWFVHVLTPERMVGAMLVLCALAAAWNTKCDPPTRRRRRLPALTLFYFGLYAALPIIIGWH